MNLRISLHVKKQKQTKMRFSFSSSVLFISIIGLPMESSVEGQFQQSASILQGKKKQLFLKPLTVTRYLSTVYLILFDCMALENKGYL